MKRPNTVKITNEELKQLIKDEIEAVFGSETDELVEINPYHKGTGKGGGQFTTKERGKIYSVPHKHKKRVKNIPTGRGTNKGGKPVAKFGVNSGSPDKQCGKVTVDGDPKRKTRRCTDYPKSYWDEVNEDLDPASGLPVSAEQGRKNKTPAERKHHLGYDRELQRLARGIYEASQGLSDAPEIYEQAKTLRRLSGLPEGLVGAQNDQLASKCRAAGFRTFEDLLKAMDAMKRASDGKLMDSKG